MQGTFDNPNICHAYAHCCYYQTTLTSSHSHYTYTQAHSPLCTPTIAYTMHMHTTSTVQTAHSLPPTTSAFRPQSCILLATHIVHTSCHPHCTHLLLSTLCMPPTTYITHTTDCAFAYGPPTFYKFSAAYTPHTHHQLHALLFLYTYFIPYYYTYAMNSFDFDLNKSIQKSQFYSKK